MSGTRAIYGYNDLDHAILCMVKDVIFKGMDILIVAECEGGTQSKCFSGWRRRSVKNL